MVNIYAKKTTEAMNYNFRNIKDVNNIVPYSTLHLKEHHLFFSYIHNNFNDCEIEMKVQPNQIFANAPHYAMPINFLLTKDGKKIAVLIVEPKASKRYSVLETKELCKENDVEVISFYLLNPIEGCPEPNSEQYVVNRIRKTLEQ